MPGLLDVTINILKDEVKDEVAIFGKTMGPWTLAYHVFGVEPFLLKSIDDPEETREILRKNPSKMYLVEKDTFLAESLKEIIDEKVQIFNDDILKFDENSLSKNKIIVFGNLPYNISTEILSTWITNLKNDY